MKNLVNFESHLNEAKTGVSKIAMDAAMNTDDAYSFDKYGKAEWVKVAQFLADKGYNQEDIEDILRSKTMRFMADAANKSKGMTATLFAKHFSASEEKAVDDMIRKELKREPKSGDSKPNADLSKFNFDLLELIAKYKGKVSDADINKALSSIISHNTK